MTETVKHGEMIERVAACIKGGSVFSQEDRLDIARAAIEAMREPTPAMQQAVAKNWGRRTWAEYSEVIDAALSPEPSS